MSNIFDFGFDWVEDLQKEVDQKDLDEDIFGDQLEDVEDTTSGLMDYDYNEGTEFNQGVTQDDIVVLEDPNADPLKTINRAKRRTGGKNAPYQHIPESVDMNDINAMNDTEKKKELARYNKNQRIIKSQKKARAKLKTIKRDAPVRKDEKVSYRKCKAYFRSLGVQSYSQAMDYVRKNQLPPGMPPYPHRAYPKQWKGSADFMGYQHVPPAKRSLPYDQFVKLIRENMISNMKEYYEFRKIYNEGRTTDILPNDVSHVYADDYKSFCHVVGLNAIHKRHKAAFIYSYELAKEFVHNLGLLNEKEWKAYTKNPNFPYFLPKFPNKYYVEFKGFKDWLGVGSLVQYLDRIQNTEVLLALCEDIAEPGVYVYQIFGNGEAGVHEFTTKGFKLIRLYEFNVQDKNQWVKLVDSVATYHEMNMFMVGNINQILFESDCMYKKAESRLL